MSPPPTHAAPPPTPTSLPPPTPTPASLPPPPTPPAPLQTKSFQQRSPDQLKLVWEERIRSIADATNRRKQLEQVEADIASTQLLLNSSEISTIPAESKARIDNELAQLERKREEIKKQREDTITQLINSDSWPAAPLTDAQDKELSRYSEIIQSVAEVKKQADEINTLLKELNTPDENAMDVDTQEGSTRRNPVPEVVPEPGPTMADLEAMNDKFSQLQSRFISFQNDVDAHDAELRQDLQYQMQLALEEFAESSKEAPKEDSPLQATMSRMDGDLRYLAQEVATQLGTLTTQTQEIKSVQERLAAVKAESLRMQQQFLAYQQERENDQKTIAALQAAVQTYINEPPPAPAVPSLSQEQLIQLMEEPLFDIVRDTIQPLIEQLRAQVQEMLNTQNAQMYKTLWSKLSLTLRMVESIDKRLQRIQNKAPAGTSAAGASARTATGPPARIIAGPSARGPFAAPAARTVAGSFAVPAARTASGPFAVPAARNASGPFAVPAARTVAAPLTAPAARTVAGPFTAPSGRIVGGPLTGPSAAPAGPMAPPSAVPPAGPMAAPSAIPPVGPLAAPSAVAPAGPSAAPSAVAPAAPSAAPGQPH